MQIRMMESGDYPEIYALWLACAGIGLNDADDSEAGFLKFLRRNPDTCFAAVENGKIVGCILVGTDGRRAYMYHMAVHPDHRRCGIGSALVQTAMAALEKVGIHKAALVVFSHNKEGNHFWEKMGFTVREDLVYRNRMV